MAYDDSNPRPDNKIGSAPATPGSNKIAPRDGKPDDKGGKAPKDDDKDSRAEKRRGEKAKAKQLEEDQKILARMRSRFTRCVSAEALNRKDMVDDRKFQAGDQWDAKTLQDRANDNRPALTINKIPTFVHQVTNAMREERPGINVNPVGDKSDIDAAKVYRGIIRHIERASAAEIAYDTGFENAVALGLGYWRVLTDFEGPNTFNQCIRIERIRNIFTVYLDPDHLEPDGADSRFGFITEMLPRDEWDMAYPDADPCPFDLAGQGDSYKLWTTKETIRIAEYFEIEMTARRLVLLSNGHEGWDDELDPKIRTMIDAGTLEVKRSRQSQVPKVCWYKASAKEILERRDWVGKTVPIVKITGDEMDVEGKVKYSGVIRFAKDAQRMYNYWSTKETEAIALAPNAPWVIEEGQIEGHEDSWKQANQKPIAVLQYKARSEGGAPVPPPTRQPFAGIPAGIVQAKQGAAEDMMATTGIRFDATPGERVYDESGRALRELRRSGDIGSYHYTDNLARALKRTGEIIIDIIPKVYDTKRVLTILREDDTEERVTIDPSAQKALGEIRDPQNQKIMKVFNPNVGKYGVTVTTGPSYATKRIEASESMMSFIRDLPQTGELIADLVAKNQDWPGAAEMGARLAKAIAMKFPGVMSPDVKDLTPQVQAVLNQLQTQLQQLTTERQQMIKALTDQQADRALERAKIDKDFEAKLLKITADLEAKTAQTQAGIQESMMTHIAAIAKNVETMMGNQTKADTAASAAESKSEATKTKDKTTGG